MGSPGGPNLGPTAKGCANWVGRIHIMCSGLLRDLYSTPGAPKRAHFWPRSPFWGPRRALGSPGGPDLGPTATGWSNWVGHMAGMLNELNWTYWASKGPKWAIWPQLLQFCGPILGRILFWAKYRHVGCPERRNGTPCSYSTISVHLEPPS